MNLLTRRRINTLIGREVTSTDDCSALYNNGGYQLRLDGIADFKTVTVEVEGRCAMVSQNSVDTFLYSVIGCEYTCTLKADDSGDLIITDLVSSVNYVFGGETGGNWYAKDDIAGELQTENGHTYIKLYFGAEPMGSTPNIKATFDAVMDEDYDKRRVQDCRFGVLFGVNGADDRLFLAGNKRYPNMDIWSEWNDLTYFPEGNAMEVGGGYSAITAYARLSDTTLAVLKEEKAGEPTIFYRTGRERTASDGVTPEQWFPVSAGIAGDGTINPHAVATLSGDVLTLTRQGVHALVLSSNVASGERYTRERSGPIYKELAGAAALDRAAGIVYRNRYYLALPDTDKCYVADAHHKTTLEGSTDYHYEWWVWDNVPATCFAEYNGQLLFGDGEGRICAFTEGIYADRTRVAVAAGDVTAGEDGSVTCNASNAPAVGDTLMLQGGVYAVLADATELSGSRILVRKGIDRLWDGQVVYADTVGDTGLQIDCAYTVDDVDVANDTFVLRDGDGALVSPATGGFRLLACMDGIPLRIAGVAEDRGSFTAALGSGEPVRLSTYNGAISEWTGEYIHREPVRAFWQTPVMDLGSNTHSKTLTALTVATEPNIHRAVTLEYETRRHAVAFGVRGIEPALDLDRMNFNAFSFAPSFACSYTKRMQLRCFNFLRIRFRSDTEEDCAVSSITLEYKIHQKNRGVR